MNRKVLAWNLVATLALGALGAAAAEPPDGTVVSERVLPLDQGGDHADAILAIADAPGGYVLVAGRTSIGNGTWGMFLARFLPGGALDPSFGSGGVTVNPFGPCSHCEIVALHLLLPSQQILVGGTVEYANGTADFLIGKLQPTGVPDTNFGVLGSVQIQFGGLGGNHHLADLAYYAPDDRIVAVGTTGWGQTDSEFAIVRLLGNGALDTSFSGDGKLVLGIDLSGDFADIARAVAIDRSGDIYVAGSSWHRAGTSGPWSHDFALTHLDWSGSLVGCFGLGGRKIISFDLGGTLNDHAYSIALSGAWLYVAGEAAIGPGAGNKAWAVAKLVPNCGTPDNSFGTNGKVTGTFACAGCGVRDAARAVAPQGNGKILVAGTGYDLGRDFFGVARLTANGALDPEFAGGAGTLLWDFVYGTGSGDDEAFAAAFAGGRLLVGGKTEWNGADTDLAWARLSNSYIFADGFDSGGTIAW